MVLAELHRYGCPIRWSGWGESLGLPSKTPTPTPNQPRSLSPVQVCTPCRWVAAVGRRGGLIASLTGRGSLVPTAATGKNGRYPPRDRHGRTRSWPAGTLRTSGSGFCCCAMRWGGSPGCVDHWLRSVVGLGCVETLLVFIQLEIDLA